MTHDLRSPAWLEASFRYADDRYISDSSISSQLSEDPKAVQDLLTLVTCSMSNRQLRETATTAEQWHRDLLLCEEEGPLPESLATMKQATYLLLHLLKNARSARSTCKSGSITYRRQ